MDVHQIWRDQNVLQFKRFWCHTLISISSSLRLLSWKKRRQKFSLIFCFRLYQRYTQWFPEASEYTQPFFFNLCGGVCVCVCVSIWRVCFQNLLHPPRHVTHLHYWLPFAIKIVQVSLCSFCGSLLFDVLHNIYKVIKSGNDWQTGVDRKGFGTKQDFIPLFFFMYVQNLWPGQKAVLTIVQF